MRKVILKVPKRTIKYTYDAIGRVIDEWQDKGGKVSRQSIARLARWEHTLALIIEEWNENQWDKTGNRQIYKIIALELEESNKKQWDKARGVKCCTSLH